MKKINWIESKIMGGKVKVLEMRSWPLDLVVEKVRAVCSKV